MPRELLLQLVLVGACTLWTVAGTWAARRLRAARAGGRRPRGGPEEGLPPVTLLVPLAGEDPALEENLERMFAQGHPRFQLLFAVRSATDPALAVLERVRARHPAVAAMTVVHEGRGALNPKVDNLLGAWPFVRHEIVAMVDSNVALAPDFLEGVARAFARRPRLGLLSHPVLAEGDGSLGTALEAAWMQGPMAASVAASHLAAGHPVVVGKAVALRRSVLERLGGLRQLGETLAEDYVLGRLFHEAGWEVALAERPVRNVLGRGGLRRFFGRQLRWAMLRARLQPLAFALEPLGSPWWVLLQLAALGAFRPALLLWAVGVELLRSATVPVLLGGRPPLLGLLLAPLRDAVAIAAWSVAPLRRHVRWRRHWLRVGAGTRLYRTRDPGGSLPPPGPLALGAS